MAEHPYLFLQVNGKDVKGESSQSSLDRKDSIELTAVEYSVEGARDPATGAATGRRRYEPIVLTKRIDKSTPLLLKAMTNNEKCEGTIKFYRPSPTGDGTTEQFFSVGFKNARVYSQKLMVLDTLDADAVHHPPLEEVSFVFATITLTYTNGGITHEDNWEKG